MRTERRVKLICLSLSIIAMAVATLLHEPPRTRAADSAKREPEKQSDFPQNLDLVPDALAAMNDLDTSLWDPPADASDDATPTTQPRYVAYRRVALLSHGAIPFPQGPGLSPPGYRLPAPYERPDLAKLSIWLDPFVSGERDSATGGFPGSGSPVPFTQPAVLISRERSYAPNPALSIDGEESDPPVVNASNLPPPGEIHSIPDPSNVIWPIAAGLLVCRRRAAIVRP